MRRSLAPSQLANKKLGLSTPGVNKGITTKQRKRRREESDSGSSSDDEGNSKEIATEKGATASATEISKHEAFIRSVLSKPFKVPIPGYVSAGGGGRSLGIRKVAGKRALHDPEAPGALIVYTPTELPTGTVSDEVSLKLRLLKNINITNGL